MSLPLPMVVVSLLLAVAELVLLFLAMVGM